MKQNSIKISIVIPVYNVEKYVKRCIDSCLNQNLPSDEYEIIVVNDGSTDNSLKLVQEYKLANLNITVLSQNNQGLSMARNNGLDIARGEYIWFVDSDDWIENNCLGDILGIIEVSSPDIIQIGFRFAYDDSNKNYDSNRGLFENCYRGRDLLKNKLIPSPAQFTLFSHAFLDRYKLRFFPGIFHEDAEFKPRAFYFAEKCCCMNKIVYNYYQRNEGSIMSSFNLKRGFDLIKVSNNLLDFQLEVGMEDDMKIVFNYLITLVLNQMITGMKKLLPENKEQLVVHFEQNKQLVNCMIGSKVLRHRLEGMIFKLSIPFGCWLYSYR